MLNFLLTHNISTIDELRLLLFKHKIRNKDVATKANVEPSMVSMVLNNNAISKPVAKAAVDLLLDKKAI